MIEKVFFVFFAWCGFGKSRLDYADLRRGSVINDEHWSRSRVSNIKRSVSDAYEKIGQSKLASQSERSNHELQFGISVPLGRLNFYFTYLSVCDDDRLTTCNPYTATSQPIAELFYTTKEIILEELI